MTPKPLTPEAARPEAQKNFDQWFANSMRSIETAKFQYERSKQASAWKKDAAFALHQATEHVYHCALLTLKLYSPKSHRLKDLRKRAEEIEPGSRLCRSALLPKFRDHFGRTGLAGRAHQAFAAAGGDGLPGAAKAG